MTSASPRSLLDLDTDDAHWPVVFVASLAMVVAGCGSPSPDKAAQSVGDPVRSARDSPNDVKRLGYRREGRQESIASSPGPTVSNAHLKVTKVDGDVQFYIETKPTAANPYAAS
jgi:hypothetical protein